ncbi:Baculoviral IAP repeat-containing protein 6 [Frankliniella fusca]|uniref:Baculoviral IAP repeat-containing protein 6 n=2 Tax=Frankliniella fusca TaxID=407009 RepID=A0AAE1H5F9_9NEOP|nr:Baculoviral IAP repeat-containing protein 6 [Frankliniella fusca]
MSVPETPTKSPSKKRLRYAPLVDLGSPPLSPAAARTDWEKCILCRGEGTGPLTCPASNPIIPMRHKGYDTLAGMLAEFNAAGGLPPWLRLEALDEGEGVAITLKNNRAVWHKSCGLKFNRQAFTRFKKQNAENMPPPPSPLTPVSLGKRGRQAGTTLRSAASPLTPDPEMQVCVLCSKGPSWKERLTRMTQGTVVEKLLTIKEKHPNPEVRGFLTSLFLGCNPADLLTKGKVYHKTCLNRYIYECGDAMPTLTDGFRLCEAIAFAELINFMKETTFQSGKNTVFKMGALIKMYRKRLAMLLSVSEENLATTHNTRFRERILNQMHELEEIIQGKEYVLIPRERALSSAVLEEDSDAFSIAADSFITLVRRVMDAATCHFTGKLNTRCQVDAVPPALLAVTSKLLFGSDAAEMSRASQPATTIAQLLLYNYKKSVPKGEIVRHVKFREPPLPLYIGLCTWGKTRKKEVIQILHALGLSCSPSRVQEITSALAQWTVDRAVQEGFLCPANLLSGLFTVFCLDNINIHTSSSTSSTGAMINGTGISALQFRTPEFHGTARILKPEQPDFSSNRRFVPALPESYSNVQGLFLHSKKPQYPLLSSVDADSLLPVLSVANYWKNEEAWLRHISDNCEKEVEELNLSWSAFHASLQPPTDSMATGVNALLPLFYQDSATVSMICHGMKIAREITSLVNFGQTPVLCMDAPLFALAKQIQWNWPDNYGEKKLVLLFGPFHIEQSCLRLIGRLLEGSGWTSVVSSAGLASETAAASFLRVDHLKKSRAIHQVTAAALFKLLRDAYHEENPEMAFDDWIACRSSSSDLFYYYIVVLGLEVLLFRYLFAVRRGQFLDYTAALKQMVVWFFALDRHNYARWISVHLKDLQELPRTAPDVHFEFGRGNMFFAKTKRKMSRMGPDQVHEQNNAVIKGDGGAVGLTEDPDALRRWMLAGPEVQRLIADFEIDSSSQNDSDLHHEQYLSFQNNFRNKVLAMKEAFLEHRNPFLHSCDDLVVLDSSVVVGEEGSKCLRKMEEVGTAQYKAFVQERLSLGTPSIFAPLKKNNFDIFNKRKIKIHGVSATVKSLEADVSLFSRLYMTMGSRHLDPHEFFQYENQVCPPSLSKDGSLYPHNKADLVPILEAQQAEGSSGSEPLQVDCLIYDGAALVHLISPRLVKTFAEYWEKNVRLFLRNDISKYSPNRVDIAWDLYSNDSLKKFVREGRGSGVLRQVSPSTPVPKDWANFLLNDKNKEQLFHILAMRAVEELSPDVLVVSNVGDKITVSQNSPQMSSSLSGSLCGKAEEADSRIILHLTDAAAHGARTAVVRSVDTDVLVLSVSFFPRLHSLGLEKLWLHFGSGSNQRLIPVHAISAKLGPEKCAALPGFHAMTGCDFTSGFRGKRKRSGWSAWQGCQEATEAFIEISQPQVSSNVSANVVRKLERFVICLYGEPEETDINNARFILYTSKAKKLTDIPPTLNTLVCHIQRAAYISGQVWGRAQQQDPPIPSPKGWGWKKDGDCWAPQWTTTDMIWQACRKVLITCKCKAGCGPRCSCRRAGVPCSFFCGNCRANCSNIAG